MTAPSPRVWITGVGLVTALGSTREATWAALCVGKSALRAGIGPDALVGAPIPDHLRSIRDGESLTGRILRLAAREAAEDAGFSARWIDSHRVATLVGVSKGDIGALREADQRVRAGETGPDLARIWQQAWPGAGSLAVAAELGLRGPCLAPVAACATGLIAAIQGAAMIQRGDCDLAIVGAGDASLDPMILGAFRRMKVLARTDLEPARAVRPWDRDRSGFLVGEGAAILVLEAENHARNRGARPYAEFAGGGFAGDAHHLTDLDADPQNLANLIARTLENAIVTPSDLDLIHVHGTATAQNDPLECRAIHRALGPHAHRVACSASKPQIGHLLGAAGAVELTLTALSVRAGFVPPTLNLDRPDPVCDLDGTPHVGRSLAIRSALKLSIGFGGHLAAAVLRRCDHD